MAAAGTTVFVSNLAPTTGWQELKSCMRKAGQVEHAEIKKDEQGRPKGWGIVQFTSRQDANRAISTLHNTMLGGRQLDVRKDTRPRQPQSQAQAQSQPQPQAKAKAQKRSRQDDNMTYAPNTYAAAPPSRSAPPRRINWPANDRRDFVANASPDVGGNCRAYVGNIPFDLTWQNVKDHIKAYLPVRKVEINLDAQGRSTGWGLAEFGTPADLRSAVSLLDGSLLAGRPLQVRPDRQQHSASAPAAPPKSAKAYRSGGDLQPAPARSAQPPAKRQFGAPRTPAAVASASQQDCVTIGRKVFVSSLDFRTNWQAVRDHFSKVGPVVHVDIHQRPDGRPKGTATVEFDSARTALTAIRKLDESFLESRSILVREDRPPLL
eukprot:NODE_740_length_1380_cov_177.709992_g558_i0.p1 GENE.NODE_740_length_1380_cov_177.709992_g558_i0~~NODE_740_length_1380_cov_177.709992_g558_i0.p1  ORF type:complete len:395 (-),score=82.23 NODE_740_length_1380_cov_177.709992_g558_i0:194-1324(-)